MPTVVVQVLEGVFSLEDKQAIIKGIAETFGKVAGKNYARQYNRKSS